jgi:hypothetical protein
VHNVDNAMGVGIDADGWGVRVSVDDDFTTGTVVELEDDVRVDTEEEETGRPLCFGDLSCHDSEMRRMNWVRSNTGREERGKKFFKI